jgi:uncharacterized membrane protein
MAADGNNNNNGDNKDKLPVEVAQVIETLPVEKRAAVARVFVRQISKYHSGPLPDAETLEHYNRIIPNGAERMMKLVEQEQAHRHSQDSTLVSSHTRLASRGQWVAGSLVVLLTAAGTYLGINGHDTLAGVVFATTIGAVTAVFVLRRDTAEGATEEEPRSEPEPQSRSGKGKRKSG